MLATGAACLSIVSHLAGSNKANESLLDPGAERRARKLRNFAEASPKVWKKVSDKPKKTNGIGRFEARSLRRDQIEERMRQVQGLLIGTGQLTESLIGWQELRDLAPGELVPDRVSRWRQEWLWLWTTYRELEKCCSGTFGQHVKIQKTTTGYQFSGLIHCDRSVCQICAEAKALDRRESLLAVIDQIPEDAQLVLKVYNNRHRKGSHLVGIEGQLRQALRGLFGLSRARKTTYGRVLTLEITWGQNGHHPHLNCLEAYRPGVVLEEQRLWEEEEFAKRIRAAGGTVDLTKQEGWWRIVDREKLIQVVHYIAKDDGSREGLLGEEKEDQLIEKISYELTFGHQKRGKETIPITDLEVPASAYAEAWCAKGLTWYSASGCFSEIKTETELTAVEIAAEEALKREKMGVTVAWLLGQTWNRFDRKSRNELAALVHKDFDSLRFLQFFRERHILGGFGLGSPPEDSPG